MSSVEAGRAPYAGHADIIRATYHGVYGYPTLVQIQYDARLADSGIDFRVNELT